MNEVIPSDVFLRESFLRNAEAVAEDLDSIETLHEAIGNFLWNALEPTSKYYVGHSTRFLEDREMTKRRFGRIERQMKILEWLVENGKKLDLDNDEEISSTVDLSMKLLSGYKGWYDEYKQKFEQTEKLHFL